MATMTEYLAALAARPDIHAIGPAVPPTKSIDAFVNPDGSLNQASIDAYDAPRKNSGLAVRRRVIVYRTDADGALREFALDFGVHDLGGAGEVVIEKMGSVAKEPADDPVAVFREQAQTWLEANATTADPTIEKWWITRVDEEQKVAYVDAITDTGAAFVQRSYIALKPDSGPVEFKPVG